MWQRFKDRLTEEAQHWYKFWSSQLAILWGIVVTTLWNEPTLLKELTDQMPDDVRAMLSPLVLAVVAGLPILVRVTKQNVKGRDQ